ncbi:MAG: glycosyltransferase family 4 protein [Microbacteriaceae bacterium]
MSEESVPIRLFFDARYVRMDFHDGISRYSVDLGNALAALHPIVLIVSDLRQLGYFPPGIAYVRSRSPEDARQSMLAGWLNKHNPDVVYSPLQMLGSFGRRFHLILTVQDLIYYRHNTPPRNLSRKTRLLWYLYHLTYWPERTLLRGADMVAVTSEATRADIVAAGLTERPMILLPPGPQDLRALLRQPFPAGGEAAPENLVYIGSYMAYKNVETLIAGMAYLPGRTLHLLSAIPAEREQELAALIPNGSRVVFHHGVSDEQYAALLADDAILVSASLDEGYGMPLAEAMTMGVPVVATDMPVFREVIGAGGRYFDGHSARAFADAVSSLDDPGVRRELVQQGQRHLARLSWHRSAQTLLDAARRLTGS